MSRKAICEEGPSRIRPPQRRKICETLVQIYGDRCFYCTRKFGGTRRLKKTLDHLLPLSRGGNNLISNLVLSCASCNQAKGDMDWTEYWQTQEFRRRRENGKTEKAEKIKPAVEIIRSRF
jgi:5-methylcytosine-specific restriction endonuclease McrA